MGKLFLPMFKIWIATIIIIAGILAIGFNSYRIMELNAANVFNEQQLFLVREAARGIRELISNIEGTLRIAADILPPRLRKHNRSAEKIFSSVLANNQGQILCLFLANRTGLLSTAIPPQSFSFSADTIGLTERACQRSGQPCSLYFEYNHHRRQPACDFLFCYWRPLDR